jgi:hypothetical protein
MSDTIKTTEPTNKKTRVTDGRQSYHSKFGKCGKDDRGSALEFRHMDLDGFNRACDRFLAKRDPEYQKRKAYWGKSKESKS